MRAAVRLVAVAFPMGVLLSRTMAWMSSGKTHAELISRLRDHSVIRSDRVYNAMLATDRGIYSRDYPYVDSPQSIGYQATISAPHMHAHALEVLSDKLTEGASVLDVGSGSGYLTACFARMVGHTGKVVGIDHIHDLVQHSIRNVRADDPELLTSGCVRLWGMEGLDTQMVPHMTPSMWAQQHLHFPKLSWHSLSPAGDLFCPLDQRGRIRCWSSMTFRMMAHSPGRSSWVLSTFLSQTGSISGPALNSDCSVVTPADGGTPVAVHESH